MIELTLECAERGCQTLFLARRDGDEWLFWCQYCARVFVVDNERADQVLRDGEKRPCSLITSPGGCHC